MSGLESEARLHGEIKRALVQAGVASFFSTHAGAEHGFEHILLETTDDRVAIKQVHDWRMTFENLRPALFLLHDKLCHITFAVAQSGKPFRALSYRFSFGFGFERVNFPFEHI